MIQVSSVRYSGMDWEPIRGGWREKAACLGEDPEIFTLSDTQSEDVTEVHIVNNEKIAKAVGICGPCPVRKECHAAASYEDRLHSVYGGEYPILYTSLGKGRPKLPLTGPCVNGHVDSWTVNNRGRRECRLCCNARRVARERKRGAKPKLTAIESHKARGIDHEFVPLVRVRTVKGKKKTGTECRTCRSDRAREARLAKIAAKV